MKNERMMGLEMTMKDLEAIAGGIRVKMAGEKSSEVTVGIRVKTGNPTEERFGVRV